MTNEELEKRVLKLEAEYNSLRTQFQEFIMHQQPYLPVQPISPWYVNEPYVAPNWVEADIQAITKLLTK